MVMHSSFHLVLYCSTTFKHDQLYASYKGSSAKRAKPLQTKDYCTIFDTDLVSILDFQYTMEAVRVQM